MSTTTEAPLPTFVPSKRRKVANLRRRRSDSPPLSFPSATSGPESSSVPTTPQKTPPSSLFRHRKPPRRFGLEVSAPKPAPTSATTLSQHNHPASTAAAAEAEALAVVNRFTHQTGQITDVDKHMMAYVEAQMSRRRGDSAGASSPSATTAAGTTTTATTTTATVARSSTTPSNQESSRTPSAAAVNGGGKSSYWAPTRPEARGATLGKLHEVDLGEEVKQRNIALTAQALSGQPGASDSSHRHPSDAKGGGGGRRHKRRRNSQDIERDRLVEEVLKETRLDLYPKDVEEKLADDEEGAADDKIAEKFRKEFIDAILSKRRRRGGEAKAKGNKKEDKKRPKGPKLGGSRMARAQMREQQGAASGAGARK